jgi:hypothetical protein
MGKNYKARKKEVATRIILTESAEDLTWVPPWCQFEDSEIKTPNKYRTTIHEN